MKILLQLCLALLLSATAYSDSQPVNTSNASFEQYPSLDDVETQAFLQQGLAYAIELYGAPRIPVNRVWLRFRPSQPFTNITDAQEGFFTIFLSRSKDEYAFYGQLAHEIPHLLNAYLYDAYAEGLNTVFAEKMLRRNNMGWSGWEEYYRKHNDPFYAATYLMMKDVVRVAGADSMRTLLRHAKAEPKDPQRMYIDIDEWISTLASANKDTVKKIILKHAAEVKRSLGTSALINSFRLPQ